MEDIIGKERFDRMKDSRLYEIASDWTGLALNKVVLGVYMDAKAGMLPGTSAIARGISLLVHTPTSPIYTRVRNYVYKKGRITRNRSSLMRYGAELLAFNMVQTPLYVLQIGGAIMIRSALDSDIDFDHHTIPNGLFEFFKNSWWLAFAGKYSMDGFRRFFGSKVPEQIAEQNIRTLEEIAS